MMSCTYQPRVYFFLTFLTTYVLWCGGAYASSQGHTGGLQTLVMLFGLMTPFLMSLAMIYRSGNPELKKDFVSRLLDLRRIQLKMLPVMFLIMPLSVLASIAVSLPFGGSVSQFGFADGFSFSPGFVPVFLLLVLAAVFEEIGWRGYAFDSLKSGHSYLKASIAFGVLWSLWHFPLVFVIDSYQYDIVHENIWFGVNFFASVIPMGVIVSWVCVKNGRSIPAAILFHLLVNLSQEMLNVSQTTKCIETGVLILVAAVIVMLDRQLFFSTGRSSESEGVIQDSSVRNFNRASGVAAS